jgi:hypothetical protein
MSDVGVIVTRHALDQLRKRDPAFNESTRNLTAAFYHEVRAALAEGRIATHKPRWARQRPGRLTRRSEPIRATRIVTSECATRCYVLITAHQQQLTQRTGLHRKTWVVLTAYVRRDEREERAA